MKYCPYCGMELMGSQTVFCTECGRELPSEGSKRGKKSSQGKNRNSRKKPETSHADTIYEGKEKETRYDPDGKPEAPEEMKNPQKRAKSKTPAPEISRDTGQEREEIPQMDAVNETLVSEETVPARKTAEIRQEKKTAENIEEKKVTKIQEDRREMEQTGERADLGTDPDDGYDGYYDDILPEDYGMRMNEGLDMELVRKVGMVVAGVLAVVCFSLLVMYI